MIDPRPIKMTVNCDNIDDSIGKIVKDSLSRVDISPGHELSWWYLYSTSIFERVISYVSFVFWILSVCLQRAIHY